VPTLSRPDVDLLDGLTTAIVVDQERMDANTELQRGACRAEPVTRSSRPVVLDIAVALVLHESHASVGGDSRVRCCESWEQDGLLVERVTAPARPAETVLALAQGIPRAAMSPAASGGRIVDPVNEEDF
jgi:hypothetical protein